MPASPVCLISLRGADEEQMLLGRRVASLRKNLEACGGRVTSYRDHDSIQGSGDLEERSDATTLATLAITFLTSGAAVALVNALRATFSAAHSAHFKAKVTVGHRSLEISGDHLTGPGAQMLEETLSKWMDEGAEGAKAS